MPLPWEPHWSSTDTLLAAAAFARAVLVGVMRDGGRDPQVHVRTSVSQYVCESLGESVSESG